MFNLCNSTWKQIVEKYPEHAIATDYKPHKMVVVLVWTVYGIIGHGGFEYLFSGNIPGDPDYKLSLESFKTIGSTDAATALQEALAVFSGSNFPTDSKERINQFKQFPEAVRDELEIRFFNADAEICEKLSKFIQSHFATAQA